MGNTSTSARTRDERHTHESGLAAETDIDLVAAAPGHAAIAACLRAQATGTVRGPVGTLLGVSPLAAHARPWFREAVCAEEVADVLDRLGAEWVVLHDVPIGAATLSHLVVGPGGVFAIESRRHAGASVWVDCADLLVSGSRTLDLDDVALAGTLAAECLERATGRTVTVHPVLVVLDAASMSVAQECDVRVVSPGHLLAVLLGSGGRLSVSGQDAVALAAADAGTWGERRSGRPGRADPDAWELLRRDVARSRTRANRWLVTGLILSALAVSAAAVLMLGDVVRLALP
jgi:Nuclease-related domain